MRLSTGMALASSPRPGDEASMAYTIVKAGSQYDAKQCVALSRLHVDAC